MAQEPDTVVACNRLRELLGLDRTLYECRDCGANLDSEDDECPACGGTEIARYDL